MRSLFILFIAFFVVVEAPSVAAQTKQEHQRNLLDFTLSDQADFISFFGLTRSLGRRLDSQFDYHKLEAEFDEARSEFATKIDIQTARVPQLELLRDFWLLDEDLRWRLEDWEEQQFSARALVAVSEKLVEIFVDNEDLRIEHSGNLMNAYDKVGDGLRRLERYEEAREYFQLSLEINVMIAAHFAKDRYWNRGIVVSKNKLHRLDCDILRGDACIEKLQAGLKDFEELQADFGGFRNEDVWDRLVILGLISREYRFQRKFEGGSEYARLSEEISESLLASTKNQYVRGHIDAVVSSADFYLNLGQYDRALEKLSTASDLLKHNSVPEGPSTDQSLSIPDLERFFWVQALQGRIHMLRGNRSESCEAYSEAHSLLEQHALDPLDEVDEGDLDIVYIGDMKSWLATQCQE